ncbi:MAG: glycosyltransferase family 2 protein, partial [Patescibacteria group bacterium]
MLTGVVLTHNEEKNIVRCLESLKFCDEILVIDDNSTDATVKLAKKLGVKVISHSLNGNYSTQRNWAIEQAKTPWVLFIDADEIVSAKLGEEIISATSKIEYKGFKLPRVDYMWGKKLLHGDVGGVKLLRLARRGAGQWQGAVHETWQIEGYVETLKHPLAHYPHPTLVEFFQHINAYSTLRAQELRTSGRRSNLFQIIFYPLGKFLDLYCLRLGLLDGTPGFVHAMTMA